jgi:hypothetical protein
MLIFRVRRVEWACLRWLKLLRSGVERLRSSLALLHCLLLVELGLTFLCVIVVVVLGVGVVGGGLLVGDVTVWLIEDDVDDALDFVDDADEDCDSTDDDVLVGCPGCVCLVGVFDFRFGVVLSCANSSRVFCRVLRLAIVCLVFGGMLIELKVYALVC